jgi:multidrug efflux system membrane fusion protein
MRGPPLLFALTLLALTACGPTHEEARAKLAIPVKVRAVAAPNAQSAARYSGSLEPATRVDLAFKVGGYIREIAEIKGESGAPHKIQEGDRVTKGTVLAAVRESDYEQKLSSAKAALAEATANQKQAQLDYDRASKLLAGNSVSKSEVDNANARLELANARVDGQQARVGEAQIALGDCVLRAPMDGVILKRGIEVGSLVAPGAVGVVLADTRSIKVVFGAPDSLLEKLKLGGSLSVTLEAVHGDFSGKITRIAPSADPKSRVFDIEATIPNPADQLKVGMIASLKLPDGAPAEASLALPLTAVVRSPSDPRGFAVYVVEGDAGQEIARLRSVKLGSVLGNTVLVTDGLKSGDRVVSMGATLVADGGSIRIIP